MGIHAWLLIVVTSIATLACGRAPAPVDDGSAGSAAKVVVAWPAGDVDAGRQAFLALKCNACHAVAGERGFPKPVSANPGPTLGPAAGTSDPSYLAAAILTPSHTLSPEISPEVRVNVEGVLSPMGDFGRVMTVRQMIDLHAYLRAVYDGTASRR